MERVTERIGRERLDQRDAAVQAFCELPVVEKFAAAVAHPPDLAVVQMDGGRLQIRDEPSKETAPAAVAGPVDAAGVATAAEGQAESEPTAGGAEADPGTAGTCNGHWREDKIGLLMTMTSAESTADSCPEIPENFVNPLRILKLARKLKKGGPRARTRWPIRRNRRGTARWSPRSTPRRPCGSSRWWRRGRRPSPSARSWPRRPGPGDSTGPNARRS